MARRRRYRTAMKALGTSPGTITYVGREIDHETRIQRIDYNATDYHIDDSSRLSACRLPANGTPFVHWLDVDGIHESKVIAAIGQQFQLHPLLLEDVVNTEQKPKVDFYETTQPSAPSVAFVTLKMLHHDTGKGEIDAEHVSFVLGQHFLISFQEERTGDIFAPVLERIKASSGKTRRNGPDYLLYALMDLLVDHYFVVLERIGDKMDELEEHLVGGQAGQLTLNTLYLMKRELTLIRRLVWPLRDMVAQLQREETPLIRHETLPYLRDLSDHVTQVIETVDSYRELLAGMMDIYYSVVNNRMNSVMKTLTIFSAIFMPLTFIAGIYGMNFANMPELQTETGYYWVLFLMFVIGVGEVIYFKRRGWM